MFDFGVLISIITEVLISYLSIFLQYRKLDKKKKMKIANITVISILIIIIFLYNLDLPTFSKITIYDFYKFLPFKEGYFNNPNFKFSFAIGMCFSLLLITCVSIWSFSVSNSIKETLISLLLLFIIIVGLIWMNDCVSSVLVYCIIHYFELFSIIFNVLVNIILFPILIFIYNAAGINLC